MNTIKITYESNNLIMEDKFVYVESSYEMLVKFSEIDIEEILENYPNAIIYDISIY